MVVHVSRNSYKIKKNQHDLKIEIQQKKLIGGVLSKKLLRSHRQKTVMNSFLVKLQALTQILLKKVSIKSDFM